MAPENIEVVRRGYEFLERRDWNGLWDLTHPHFELRTQMQGTHRGRDEAQGFVEEQIGAFETWTMKPEKFFESGDQVVAFVVARAQPKGTAAEIEIKIGHIWTIVDGMILTLETFPQREAALEAAGLSK